MGNAGWRQFGMALGIVAAVATRWAGAQVPAAGAASGATLPAFDPQPTCVLGLEPGGSRYVLPEHLAAGAVWDAQGRELPGYQRFLPPRLYVTGYRQAGLSALVVWDVPGGGQEILDSEVLQTTKDAGVVASRARWVGSVPGPLLVRLTPGPAALPAGVRFRLWVADEPWRPAGSITPQSDFPLMLSPTLKVRGMMEVPPDDARVAERGKAMVVMSGRADRRSLLVRTDYVGVKGPLRLLGTRQREDGEGYVLDARLSDFVRADYYVRPVRGVETPEVALAPLEGLRGRKPQAPAPDAAAAFPPPVDVDLHEFAKGQVSLLDLDAGQAVASPVDRCTYADMGPFAQDHGLDARLARGVDGRLYLEGMGTVFRRSTLAFETATPRDVAAALEQQAKANAPPFASFSAEAAKQVYLWQTFDGGAGLLQTLGATRSNTAPRKATAVKLRLRCWAPAAAGP